MTDQFSQEYIDYILSDEAKGLRRGHAWIEGDHYLEPEVSMVPVIVDAIDMTIYSADLAGVVWLPTLWDLLQIIEGAGCTWERGEEEWILWGPGNNTYPLAEEWLDENYGNDMLAAAKLAAKALTDPDYTNREWYNRA